MGAKISKIEYVLPANILTNQELSSSFPEWTPEKIEEKLGIVQRHITAESETALDLAITACEKVLKEVEKNSIDFLVLCTQSPEYYLPTTACILQEKLGLPTSVGAFDFNLGCSGFIYGLAIAKGFIKANIAHKVLLVTAETYSKHININDKGNRTIFGDAAAAVIIEKDPHDQIFDFVLGTDGSGANNLIVPNGAMKNRYDPNATLINSELENTGRTDNDLYMNGPEIFNFTIQRIPKLISMVLEKNNCELGNIDYFVFHQANKYMLEYLRKKMKVPASKFYNNLRNTGNTVSSTIPIALKDCIETGVIKKGNTVLLAGFGVGYSWGATIIKIP